MASVVVDRILRSVPYRQLVVSFPMPVARLRARKPKLLSRVRQIFFRAVRVEQRRAARAVGVV